MALKAAILGTGFMGKQHLEIWEKLGAKPVLCSSDAETGKALALTHNAAFYEDFHTLFEMEKPDAVSVCLPTYLHYEAVKEALLHGIPVLCEKPFASNSKEAAELCRLSQEKGILLMVGHPLRFSKEYAYLKNLVRDRRFGSLQVLHMYRHSERPAWSVGGWLSDTALSGGAVRDLHIHETDMLLSLLGMPEGVTVTGNSAASTTLYDYRDGAAISASASWRNAPGYPFTSGYDAVFENAAVECRGKEITLFCENRAENPHETEALDAIFSKGSDLENEIAYFYRCLQNGEQPALCPPEESLAALQLNEAEILSLTSKRTIALSEE